MLGKIIMRKHKPKYNCNYLISCFILLLGRGGGDGWHILARLLYCSGWVGVNFAQNTVAGMQNTAEGLRLLERVWFDFGVGG